MNNIINNNINVNNSNSLGNIKLIDLISKMANIEEKAKNEELQAFYDFVNQDCAIDKIKELKLKFVPSILVEDINSLVERKYKGDFDEYIKDIEIYYNTFTLNDFIISELSDNQELKEKSDKINRLCEICFGFYPNKDFRKKLKNKYKKTIWHAQVLLKLIGGDTNINYICKSLEYSYKSQYKKNQDFVKNSSLINEKGRVFKLADVIRTQKQKTAEHFNIMKCFERFMEEGNQKRNENNKIDWLFITLTLSPELHPNPTRGKNSYNGISPADSARKQKQDWNKVRALLKKRNILPGLHYYGVVVSEAHKDGCQHLHIVMFYVKKHYKKIRDSFFSVFPNLNEDQSDKKCSFKKNNGKAKASSYVFKYITKATSNFDLDTDIFNIDTDKEKNGALKNSAFRSYNATRGIQYFGIENCLTKWRFICRNKRIKLNSELEEIVKANDFFTFITKGHYKYIKNIYITKNENKKFIGCEISGIDYFKKFFIKIVKEVVNDKKEEKRRGKEYKYAVRKYRNEIIALRYMENIFKSLVLVSHNYSRDCAFAQSSMNENDLSLIL